MKGSLALRARRHDDRIRTARRAWLRLRPELWTHIADDDQSLRTFAPIVRAMQADDLFVTTGALGPLVTELRLLITNLRREP